MDEWEKVAYNLSTGFCALAMKALDYRLIVHGKENIPKGRAIIAANHASYLDPISLAVGLGKLTFIARDLDQNHNFMGGMFQRWLKLAGVITIDGRKMQRDALVQVLDKLEKGNKVAIFPEGTRSIDGKLGYFNNGISLIAELSDSPVVPVSLSGTYEIWPRHGRIKYSGEVRLNVCNRLYLNKQIADKSERRKDLTERIRSELESSLIYSH